MTSLSPWTAMRCMWLGSQAHRGKPKGHACRTSPRSVSSRRFASFAQKAVTHRCNGLDVPTPCHHHHATAPPIYVKGRPYFVSKENPSNRLPHLHCSRSRSWEASYSSTCAWACLCRWRAPCEHKHLSSAQALQASSPSLRSWGLRKLRSGHPLRNRGIHHQPQAVERPAVLLRAIRRSAPPLSPPFS